MTLQGTLLTQSGKVMTRSGKPLVAGVSGEKDCCCADPCCTGSYVGYFTGKLQSHQAVLTLTHAISQVFYTYPSDPGPNFDFYFNSDLSTSLLLASDCNSFLLEQKLQTSASVSPIVWSSASGYPKPTGVSDNGSTVTVSPGTNINNASTGGGTAGPVSFNGEFYQFSSILYTTPQSVGGTLLYSESGFDSSLILALCTIRINSTPFYHDGSTKSTDNPVQHWYMQVVVDYLGRTAIYDLGNTFTSTPPYSTSYSSSATPTYDGAAMVGCTISLSATTSSSSPDTPLTDITANFVLTSNMKGCPT